MGRINRINLCLLLALPSGLWAEEEAEALVSRLTRMLYRAVALPSAAPDGEEAFDPLSAIALNPLPDSPTPAVPLPEGAEAALFPRLAQAIYRAALSPVTDTAPRALPAVTLNLPTPTTAAPPPVNMGLAPLQHVAQPPPRVALPPPPPTPLPAPAASLPVNMEIALLPCLTRVLPRMDLPEAPVADAAPGSLAAVALDLPLATAGVYALHGDAITAVPGAGGDYPLKRPQVALPVAGLTAEQWERAMARLVLEGLTDGSLNPRSPEWRPYLASMLGRPETRDPDTVFSLILAGCAGNADPARLALAQKWAQEHEGGRFSGTVDLFAARHFFFLGSYPEAIRRAGLVAKQHPGLAVNALLLTALAEAHSGNTAAAAATVRNVLNAYPDSPDIPEIRYMEAWLALQDRQAEDAKRLLAAIVADYPRTPTATKAAKMLATLEDR